MVSEEESKVQQIARRRTHTNGGKQRDQFFVIRNILNIIFMVGAVVGVLIYLFGDTTIGTIVVLAAMVFKMAECTFRFFN